MQPTSFDYHRPETLEEALELLSTVEGARALAGGHSLLPAMKLRLSVPSALVDVGRIPGLSGITASDGHLVIGATTTHAEIEHSALVAAQCGILAEAAAQIGDPAVRNRGTIGGSLAHADPAGDLPTVIVAIDASITARSTGGERTIAGSEFFTGLFATALDEGEVITSVEVPVLGAGSGGAYVKHKHPASGYAVVGVAAVVHKEGGTIDRASVAVGGASPNPAVVDGSGVIGTAGTAEAIAAVAAAVSEAISDPIGDVYASGEYRVHLAGVLTSRALERAVERAG